MTGPDLHGGKAVAATYELRVEGPAPPAAGLEAALKALAADLDGLDGLLSADLYRPEAGDPRDPYFEHASPPPAVLLIDFRDAAARAAGIASCAALAALRDFPEANVTSAFLKRAAYPLRGAPGSLRFEAPVSNVVRYRRPHSDEAAFTDFYLATHPATEARLPGIRAIFCYLPDAGTDPHGFTDAGYVMGNEVAFDDLEAFNTAMASAVREEMRAHFRRFPPFSGRLTHDLMRRERLTGARQ